MPALRIVMLLVAVLVCYLLFFHPQTKVDTQAVDPLQAEITVAGSPTGSLPTARTQYKEAVNRAHAAAKSMQDERKEADSY